MFQESELITLFVSMVFLLVVLPFVRQELPRLRLFLAAYFFLLAAQVLTVVEGFYLHDLCNILEHTCYTVAGFFFAAGCRAGKYLDVQDPEEAAGTTGMLRSIKQQD